MPRVVHFEIHAADPARAQAFYGDLFGWEFKPWGAPDQPPSYWLISTGEGRGIDGGLLPRRGPEPAHGQPVNAMVCTVDVDAIDDVVARALEMGGAIAVPKNAVPGVGWLAYIKDSEGNILGLMQRDPEAR